MSNIKRVIYIVLGTLFLVLGAIGVVLPLLPTTPFWLLTCWFYIRSSEKLYNKAMANPYFGAYVKSFLVDKSIPVRIKFISVGMLWTTIAISTFFMIEKTGLKSCCYVSVLELPGTYYPIQLKKRMERSTEKVICNNCHFNNKEANNTRSLPLLY